MSRPGSPVFSALRRDWADIQLLLDEALDLPAERTDRWLDELAGRRPELRAVLGDLLARRRGVQAGQLRDAWAAMPVDDADNDDDELPASTTIGPYRLLRKLGRGGMGTVWLAERSDGSLTRQVALKLPHKAWGRGTAERLARESDILGRLVHPHIARLYDAGVDERGRPWLAMEFVDGLPIDAWCDRHDADLPTRLRLLQQVCDAVAHAHALLVVHRDLKPGNIFVSGDGGVRLLDFGIAKLMDGDRTRDTALTQSLGRALTMHYASPEQIRGEPLGTASDVYSLAVVAFELLAGSSPYRLKRGSAGELEEAIVAADAPRASDVASAPARRRELRGDLDAILAKAMRGRAGDRYPTVAALALDLQRHLDGRPVEARPDSRWYVAGRFVRRHRLPVAALAAVAMALGAGLGVALWQAREAAQQSRRAERASDLSQTLANFYLETFTEVATLDADRLARPGAVARVLTTRLDEVEKNAQGTPAQRLALLESVAKQLSYLPDADATLAMTRRYIAALEASGDAAGLMHAREGLASTLAHAGRYGEAEQVLADALAAPEAATVAGPVRARALIDLANAQARQGKRSEAQRALSAADALLPTTGADAAPRTVLLQTQYSLSAGYDTGAAVRAAEAGHALLLRDPAANRPQFAASYLYLAAAYASAGRPGDAEAAARESLSRYETMLGPLHSDTNKTFTRLAYALAAQGRYDEAGSMLAERRRRIDAGNDADAPVVRQVLSLRQLQVDWMRGDVDAGAAHVLDDTSMQGLLPSDALDAIADAGRWRVQSKRAAESVAFLQAWLARVPARRRNSPDDFKLRLALAESQWASGQQAPAGATLQALRQDMTRVGAVDNWTFREATERHAVALATAGDAAGAVVLLQSLDPGGADAPRSRPLSLAHRAESTLRRARVMLAAGRADECRSLVAAARADLVGQHPGSPRLVDLRELAARVGA